MAEEEELLDFDDDMEAEDGENLALEDPEDVADEPTAIIEKEYGGGFEEEEPSANGSEKSQERLDVSASKEDLMKGEEHAHTKNSSGDEVADLEDGELTDLTAEFGRKAEEGGDPGPHCTTDVAPESPRGTGASKKRDSQRDRPERSGHQSSDRNNLKRLENAGGGPNKRPRPWQPDTLRGSATALGSRGLGPKGIHGGHSLIDNRRGEMLPGIFGGGNRLPMDLHMALYGAGTPHFGAGFPGGQPQLDLVYQMSILHGQHLAQDLLSRQNLIYPPSSRSGPGRPRSSPPPPSRSAARNPPDRHVSRNPPRPDTMFPNLSNGSVHGPGGPRQRRSGDGMGYPESSSRAGWPSDVGLRGLRGGGGMVDMSRGPHVPPPGSYRQPYMVSQWWDPGPMQPELVRGERRDAHVGGGAVGSRRRSERETGRGASSPPRVSSRKSEGDRGGGRNPGREDLGSRRRDDPGYERDRKQAREKASPPRAREKDVRRREGRRPTGFDVGPEDIKSGVGAGSGGLAGPDRRTPLPPPPPRSPAHPRSSAKGDVAIEKLPPPPPLPPGGLVRAQRVGGAVTSDVGGGSRGGSDTHRRQESAEKLSPQAVVQIGSKAKTRTLAVSGLPADFPISSVVTAFEQQGQVSEFSRKDAHFYITYDTVNEAISAQRSFHRSTMGGHQITVGYA